MKEFNPTYNKCKDTRKNIYWNVCQHMIKNNIVLCTLGAKNKPCPAWEGYSHKIKIKHKKINKQNKI